jgi:hypothetical protein
MSSLVKEALAAGLHEADWEGTVKASRHPARSMCRLVMKAKFPDHEAEVAKAGSEWVSHHGMLSRMKTFSLLQLARETKVPPADIIRVQQELPRGEEQKDAIIKLIMECKWPPEEAGVRSDQLLPYMERLSEEPGVRSDQLLPYMDIPHLGASLGASLGVSSVRGPQRGVMIQAVY